MTTQPTATRMVLRGLAKRCGRCGERRIFRTYFSLEERCPRCGYRFVREEGAFTGAMLMNFAGTLTLMILPLFAYIAVRGISGEEVGYLPYALACVGLAVVVPFVFYPFAASWWAAIDLAMRPLDPKELADADAHRRPLPRR